MSFIQEWWPIIEEVSLILYMVILVLTLGSLNFYFKEISQLIDLDNHYKKHKTVKGYRENTLPIIEIITLIHAILPISKFNQDLYNYKIGREKFDAVLAYRKMYKIIFPILIIAAIIGIFISEYIQSYT